MYDPATDTWEQDGPSRHPRDGMACGVIDNKLYVVGGRADFTGPAGLLYNEVYDPFYDTWTPSGKYLWNNHTYLQGNVITDAAASYQGNYGLVVQRDIDDWQMLYTQSYKAFGAVYALDLRWNVTDDLGVGAATTRPDIP